MSEIINLRKQTKAQASIIQEQEVTIAEQQAEIMRLKSRVVANRRGNRIGKKVAHA